MGDRIGQAIGAQQQAVTGQRRDVLQRGLDRVAGVGLEDQGALRVGGDILGIEFALRDQGLDEGVVHCELGQLAVAKQIRPGVADVAHAQLASVEHERGERGAHPVAGGVLADALRQRGVGLIGDHAQQCEHVIVARVGVQGAQVVDHQLRGDLAGCVAAHAVGKRQQVGARVGGVLIVAAHQTPVGGHRIIKFQHQGTSLTVVRPTRISVPSSICSGWSMRTPLTKVPLRESRSSTNHSAPRLKMRACRPEA